jgi:hypothetical protein
MTAPIASGWSDRRVGLAPTGKRRRWAATPGDLRLPGIHALLRQNQEEQVHGGFRCKSVQRPASETTESSGASKDQGAHFVITARIKNAREEAIEPNEHQSVDGTEGLFLGAGSS